MKTQNYNNHIRYYPPHHFVFYPIMLALFCMSLYGMCKSKENTFLWSMITLIICMVIWLAFMMRQHYALSNQNRIVRLELRFRYYTITHQRFEPIESKLSLSQVLALRFASDEELPELVERALSENLSPDAIKKSIKHWIPDYMRV